MYSEYKNEDLNYQCYLLSQFNTDNTLEKQYSYSLSGHILNGRYIAALRLLRDLYPSKTFLTFKQFLREKRLSHLLDS